VLSEQGGVEIVEPEPELPIRVKSCGWLPRRYLGRYSCPASFAAVVILEVASPGLGDDARHACFPIAADLTGVINVDPGCPLIIHDT
jgi:hypothetical protein